jgi:hypothetical protein
LVNAGADVAVLNQPVHAERLEHLLTVIAMALTKRGSQDVAPWTRTKGTKGVFAKLALMKAWGANRGN